MLKEYEETRHLDAESGQRTINAWKDVEEKRNLFLAATREVRATINSELAE